MNFVTVSIIRLHKELKKKDWRKSALKIKLNPLNNMTLAKTIRIIFKNLFLKNVFYSLFYKEYIFVST